MPALTGSLSQSASLTSVLSQLQIFIRDLITLLFQEACRLLRVKSTAHLISVPTAVLHFNSTYYIVLKSDVEFPQHQT